MLGGRDEAENVSLLLEHGVTHILNTAQQLPNYFPQHFVYLKFGLLGNELIDPTYYSSTYLHLSYATVLLFTGC